MELEDISIKQMENFCGQFDCELDEFKPSYIEGFYYLRMFNANYKLQPEFEVTENSCIGTDSYKGYNLTKQWLKFLDSIEKEQSQVTTVTL